jgi:nicotinate-nucleotide--dimethylbenzimidazole phosphoribosyltransferase
MGDLLSQTLGAIKPLDKAAMEVVRARQDNLTKPKGSLGKLEELSIRIAGIKGKPLPQLRHKAIVTMVADHGVATEGTSLYPQEVTAQMVSNFLHGGAGINVLARLVGARVVVVDIGVATDLVAYPQLVSKKVAYGTRNMAREPAMTPKEALSAVEVGIEVVEAEVTKGLDIVGTGDMGIGNTTASSAICAAITGKPVEKITGRGTGLDDRGIEHKREVIKQALATNQPSSSDPLDVLAKVGGLEIGGLAGVILGAAAHHIPVVIDGFISGAAALIAVGLSGLVKEYLIPAHLSAEAGHQVLLHYLELSPLLNLEMRLGEGTGAALGIFLAEAAVRILSEMATFAEAGVSEAKD